MKKVYLWFCFITLSVLRLSKKVFAIFLRVKTLECWRTHHVTVLWNNIQLGNSKNYVLFCWSWAKYTVFSFSFNFLPSLLTKIFHDQYNFPDFPDIFSTSQFLIAFLILWALLLWFKYLNLLNFNTDPKWRMVAYSISRLHQYSNTI